MRGILDLRLCLGVLVLLGVGGVNVALAQAGGQDPVVLREFVFTQAGESSADGAGPGFAECHASTVLEVGDGARRELLVAWFGGTSEGADDVQIWLARRPTPGGGSSSWSPPRVVASSSKTPPTAGSRAQRLPTWNPVLYQGRAAGAPVELFYKVGPNPRQWWGAVVTSLDEGRTWGAAALLPEGILGPIRSRPISGSGGALLAGSSTEHDGWRVHFERRDALGDWRRVEVPGQGAPQSEDPGQIDAIQPTFLRHAEGRIQALCRTRQKRIAQTFSSDEGATWSALELTDLPNPSAGIEAVTLPDGRHLLIYNHSTGDEPWPRSRSRLNVALSKDGVDWYALVELENDLSPESRAGRGEPLPPGEYSYPAAIVDRDGRVHVTYTWRRRNIRHVVLDPTSFADVEQPERRIIEGVWPGDR
jgi:predicted neuraminidase